LSVALVVEHVRVPGGHDDLRDDDRDDVVGALAVELVEVAQHRPGELAVSREEDVELDRDLVLGPLLRDPLLLELITHDGHGDEPVRRE
jgi:hypothetical protein